MEDGVDVMEDGFRPERGFEIARAVRDEVEADGGGEGFDEVRVDVGFSVRPPLFSEGYTCREGTDSSTSRETCWKV